MGQSVDTSHPNAAAFLRSDCANTTRFFAGKGVAVLPVDELVALVTDKRVAPHPTDGNAQRTGSYAGSVPAPGSGLRVLDRLVEDDRVARDACEGIIRPVDSALHAAVGGGVSADAVGGAATGAAASVAGVAAGAASAGAAAAVDADDSDRDDADDDDDPSPTMTAAAAGTGTGFAPPHCAHRLWPHHRRWQL